MTTAFGIGFGWSTSVWAPFCIGIRYFTRPMYRPWVLAKWSHMFIVFRLSDESVVIHEALGSKGWQSNSIQKLNKWIAESPKTHKAEIYWLPVPADIVQSIFESSSKRLGRTSYAWRQIAAFAIANSMIGRWLGLALANRDKTVVCSEEAARQVGEKCPAWDLRDSPNSAWDSVSPQSAYDELMRRRFQSQ